MVMRNYRSFVGSNEQFSSALLPADGENVSPALMPSLQTDLWSPDLALRNHTSRTIRFDEIHSSTRLVKSSDKAKIEKPLAASSERKVKLLLVRLFHLYLLEAASGFSIFSFISSF